MPGRLYSQLVLIDFLLKKNHDYIIIKNYMKKFPSLLLPIIFIILAASGGGYVWINREKYFPKPQEEQAQVINEKWRKNGEEYLVTWEYPISEGRTGKVGFMLTLDGNVITDVGIEILTTNETSLEYQEAFRDEIAQFVVGKKLSEIADIDVVGGASSTTENFKAAVAALEQQGI